MSEPAFIAHCDFCSSLMQPKHLTSRTCPACRRAGAPDQGDMTWKEYMEVLKMWRKSHPRRTVSQQRGSLLARSGSKRKKSAPPAVKQSKSR